MRTTTHEAPNTGVAVRGRGDPHAPTRASGFEDPHESGQLQFFYRPKGSKRGSSARARPKRLDRPARKRANLRARRRPCAPATTRTTNACLYPPTPKVSAIIDLGISIRLDELGTAAQLGLWLGGL